MRLAGLVLTDPNFEILKQATQSGDLGAAFEAAHALKGVLANLEITPILAPVSDITESLRKRTEMDYGPLLTEIDTKYRELYSLCGA